jgi:hypothetical protein
MIRKWLAIGIILLFVGTCIIPAIAESAPIQNEKRNKINYCLPLIPTSKAYVIGIIRNLSVNGSDYFFECLYVRALVVYRFDSRNWELQYFHFYRINWTIENINFRGILKPNFICGVFY